MGVILSRFRRKKTTIEILEDLDLKIKEIEQYGQNTEQRHKKIVGTLILYSVILYIITAFIFYFYFFPASLYDQIFYIIPLLMFPLLIILTKRMVSWYYKRKISRNQEKLGTMQSEKKKILDEVTETETYKKAKEILLKFAPDQLKMTPLSPQQPSNIMTAADTPRRSSTPAAPYPLHQSTELRKRIITNQNQQVNVPNVPINPGLVPVGASPIQNPRQSSPYPTGPRTRLPLPRPILPRQRSYLDRLIDYLVGDGPSYRYALICRNCESHNGMALKEEFEYFGYRCCYCNYWNSARKQKPFAPKLEYEAALSHRSSISTSEHSTIKNVDSPKQPQMETPTASDTDSDIEVVERPSEASEGTEHIPKSVESKNEEKEDEEVEMTEETKEEKKETFEKMDVDESFS